MRLKSSKDRKYSNLRRILSDMTISLAYQLQKVNELYNYKRLMNYARQYNLIVIALRTIIQNNTSLFYSCITYSIFERPLVILFRFPTGQYDLLPLFV